MTPSLDTLHRLIGIDYGIKRIGFASAILPERICSPLTTLKAQDGKPRWEAVTELLTEPPADAIVIGIPLELDGSDMPITHLARRFANQLHGRYRLPVFHADERHSSVAAHAQLKHQRQLGRGRIQRADVDKMAATLILQHWLEQHP